MAIPPRLENDRARSFLAERGDLGIDQFAHEFRRHPGVLVGVFDANGPAANHGQLVAELITEVAFVTDLAHGSDEVSVVTVGVLTDNTVVSFESSDRTIG